MHQGGQKGGFLANWGKTDIRCRPDASGVGLILVEFPRAIDLRNLKPERHNRPH
jgi:hypothetical protein